MGVGTEQAAQSLHLDPLDKDGFAWTPEDEEA